MTRSLLPLSIVAAAVSIADSAPAQSSLDRDHAAGYYVARGTGAAAAVGLALALPATLTVPEVVPSDPEWFPGDQSVRGDVSMSAARASDMTAVTTLTIPLAAELGDGLGTRFANTSVLYGEVLSAQLLLNTAVKYSVHRARPYTHGREPAVQAYVQSEGRDAYLSFYSGHSSGTWAAAMAGSYLFAATHPDSPARFAMWSVESALAGATAVLRVRAGKHYYSDVLAGALVGALLGIGLPLLEGVTHAPSAEEYAFLFGGLAVGTGLAEVVPFERNVIVRLGAAVSSVALVPSDRGAKLSLAGRF